MILPDICRAGGISEGRKIATVASLYATKWAAHVSMGSSVHVAAAAHLAAASANFLIFEFSSTPNPIGEDLLTAPLHPEGGICGCRPVPASGSPSTRSGCGPTSPIPTGVSGGLVASQARCPWI